MSAPNQQRDASYSPSPQEGDILSQARRSLILLHGDVRARSPPSSSSSRAAHPSPDSVLATPINPTRPNGGKTNAARSLVLPPKVKTETVPTAVLRGETSPSVGETGNTEFRPELVASVAAAEKHSLELGQARAALAREEERRIREAQRLNKLVQEANTRAKEVRSGARVAKVTLRGWVAQEDAHPPRPRCPQARHLLPRHCPQPPYLLPCHGSSRCPPAAHPPSPPHYPPYCPPCSPTPVPRPLPPNALPTTYPAHLPKSLPHPSSQRALTLNPRGAAVPAGRGEGHVAEARPHS